MTFRTALTALSNLNVTGISSNLDVDSVPDSVRRGQLPMLLVLPVNPNMPTERGQGFETVAFADGAKTVTYRVTHLLLIAPAQQGKGLRGLMPDLIDAIDNYFTALSLDALLNATLLEPVQVTVEPGLFSYGGVEYVGCAFRHQWLIEV